MAIERGVDAVDVDELGIEDNTKEIEVATDSAEDLMFDGMDDEDAYNKAKELYATIHNKPVYKCTIEEAEMIKVTYNT